MTADPATVPVHAERRVRVLDRLGAEPENLSAFKAVCEWTEEAAARIATLERERGEARTAHLVANKWCAEAIRNAEAAESALAAVKAERDAALKELTAWEKAADATDIVDYLRDALARMGTVGPRGIREMVAQYSKLQSTSAQLREALTADLTAAREEVGRLRTGIRAIADHNAVAGMHDQDRSPRLQRMAWALLGEQPS